MNIKSLRASSAHRWWNCLGSPRAEMIAPVIEAREVSLEGSAAHYVLEHCLRKRLDAEVFLEETVRLPIEKVVWGPIKEDMVDHIQDGLDLIRSKRGKGMLWIESNIQLPTKPIPVRGKLDVSWYGRYLNAAGKYTWQLHVLDLKYGRLLVEAHDNKQLKLYAEGKLRELYAAKKPVDEIHLWIYQPRSTHPDGPFQHVVLTPYDMAEFKLELIDKVQAIVKPNAPLTAGRWCLYCGYHALCPAAEQANMRIIRTKLSEDDTGRIGELLHKKPQVVQWLKALTELASSMAANNVIPVGWIKTPGSNRRYFRGDPKSQLKEVVPKLKKQYGFKDADLIESKLRSVRKIETLLPKEKREDFVKKFVVFRRTADKLVPADSGRQALNGATYFDDEDDGQVD